MVRKIKHIRGGLKPFYSCSIVLELFNHVLGFKKGIWTLASFLPKTLSYGVWIPSLLFICRMGWMVRIAFYLRALWPLEWRALRTAKNFPNLCALRRDWFKGVQSAVEIELLTRVSITLEAWWARRPCGGSSSTCQSPEGPGGGSSRQSFIAH